MSRLHSRQPSTIAGRRGRALRKAPAAIGRDQSGSFAIKVLTELKSDPNLIYLAARMQSHLEACAARLVSLRQALRDGEEQVVVELAHSLSELCARLGAMPMMKLCIAVQLTARRGLLGKAEELADELELEFRGFQDCLIPRVG